ncbi:MAG: MBOAT family protein, partial [Clostridia bacterium]|nr:MBOAT family protein [Clostridia bacterium]
MTFNSGEFLIFFPITLLLYFLLPKKLSRYSLLFMSCIFYLSWDISLIWLIFFTTAVSYFSSHIIERTDKVWAKRICIVVTLVACLGVLFFFKYYNFLAETLGWAIKEFGGGTYDFTLDLVLPVGISFYTFQTLSYVIDVYRGEEKAEKNFATFCLYVTFFPQLVAGPIERPGNLLPQLKEKNKLTAENARIGLSKMAVGFFKKIVVADILAEFVNAVYNDAAGATGPALVVATMFFGFQIYCDFSGYTDIAIGCARVMGIRLMKNFDRPYKALSIKEFWARWHISLSTWFRDYLYFPLGGSRCSKPRHMFNLFMVFFVSGLWHGANWTFVLWGLIHAAYRIVGELTAKPRKALYAKMRINTNALWFKAGQKVTTFVLVCFAWVFFRANNLADVGTLLSSLTLGWADVGASLSSTGLNLASGIVAILSLVIMTELDILTERSDDAREITAKNSTVYAVWAIAVAWLLLLSVGGASTFIYF